MGALNPSGTPGEPRGGAAEDEAAVRAIEDAYNAAWNRHDPAGMVESMVPDAQVVTVTGRRFDRDGFRASHERLQRGAFKDSRRETLAVEVRFLGPEVAVVHSRFTVAGDLGDAGLPRPAREGQGTRVVRKLDGRWRTVAVHNTDVMGTEVLR